MISRLFNKAKENKEFTNELFLEELLKKDIDENRLKEFLYSGEIDLNFKDKSKNNFLQICLEKDKFRSAKWLIHNNIDLENKNIFGQTPFDIAYEKRNHTIVRLLLSSEIVIDINKQDRFKRTMLQDSVITGDLEMAKILIEYGADINLKDQNNRNVIFDAISYGNEQFIEYLLSFEHLELNNIDIEGNTILHHPQVIENDNLAKKLIVAGADPTIKDKDGNTYLCNTALRGIDSYHIIETAVKQGYNINSRVAHENTILMELIKAQSSLNDEEKYRRKSLFDVSRKVVTDGLDLNAINDKGETALFRAVRVEDIDLIKFLIQSGINVNIQNHQKQTALHIAIYQGAKYLDTILLLLRHGASPLVKDEKNRTLYEILNELILHTHGKKQLTDQFLLSHIKQDGQYILILKEILEFFKDKHDLNFFDSYGNPLFFEPLLYDHYLLFRLYMKYGLNIHKTNVLGHNVFFEYVLKVFEDDNENVDFQNILTTLVSSKVDQNFQDETGYTVVHKIMETNANLTLFDILTQVILFDYSKTDKLGRSAIHAGVWHNKTNIIKRIHQIDPNCVNIPDGYGILPITYAALLGSQELVIAMINLGSNVKSDKSISEAVIEKFKPMLKNLDKLKDDITDEALLRKLDILIDQVKRDFKAI